MSLTPKNFEFSLKFSLNLSFCHRDFLEFWCTDFNPDSTFPGFLEFFESSMQKLQQSNFKHKKYHEITD